MVAVLVVLVILIVAVVLIAGIVLFARGRSSARSGSSATDGPVPSTMRDETPMTGLESALDKATAHDGRPMREALDAETAHVDDLRVPDDTGPLLRRALDHVVTPDDVDGDAGDRDEGDGAT